MPFLRLLHFDQLGGLPAEAREVWGREMEGTEILFLFYADDVGVAVEHRGPDAVVRVANRCVSDARVISKGRLDHTLNTEKFYNLVISPEDFIAGRYRRRGTLSFATRRALL